MFPGTTSQSRSQNIPFAGPNVPVAPDADPGDGLLDVVLIGEAQRKALLAYFDARMHARSAEAPKLPVHRGREIELVPPPDVALTSTTSPGPTTAPARRAPSGSPSTRARSG